jgi:hypothetical protein
MFARIKKSGRHQYLQIVENRRDGKKTVQRVIATLGRMDHLQDRGDIETLARSLSRFSERVLLILSGRSDVRASAKKIGPALIFDRLWNELGVDKIIRHHLAERKVEFNVERAVFMTVLHRLFVSGSDRCCDKWHRDYVINGVEELSLHHFYRAMAFLGEESVDQTGGTPFSPRCMKDHIEEDMFQARRDLFSDLEIVFFDTTSIYFEGAGGETLGRLGHSKDHRPDLNQIIVGVVIDNNGNPICCEMWPGNIADVKSLIPVIERTRRRFRIKRFCVVADRGMISDKTLVYLEQEKIPYFSDHGSSFARAERRYSSFGQTFSSSAFAENREKVSKFSGKGDGKVDAL